MLNSGVSIHHTGTRQAAAHIPHTHQNFIQQFIRQRGHPAPGALLEPKSVNVARWHIDQRARRHGPGCTVQTGGAATRLDQQYLVQPGVPVRRQFPAMQDRTLGNRLAMHHIRQMCGFAEQAIRLDRGLHLGHVRNVQDLE